MAAGIPNSLKAVKPFLIISNQLESKKPVVSYYVRMYGIQEGLAVAKNDPVAKAYLLNVMDQLSALKKALKGEDALADDTVGQSIVEEYALSLFDTADAKDRAADFSKGVSKAFYTASQLFVTLKQFGELSEEIDGKMKYAKWKAVEIDRCLKNGITPTPGPPGGFDDPNDLTAPPTQPPPGNYGDQPGPSGSYYGDQPGPSGGYSYQEQPEPTGSYGYQPGPSNPQPQEIGFGLAQPQPQEIGFGLPPVVSSEPSPQPQLPPEIKPVPKPRHDPTPPQPAVRHNPNPTPPQPVTSFESPSPSVGGVNLSPVETAKAQKYCKFASSAIEYDDIEGALEYLAKATRLLQTGKED